MNMGLTKHGFYLRSSNKITYGWSMLFLTSISLFSCQRSSGMNMEAEPTSTALLERIRATPDVELFPHESVTLLEHYANLGKEVATVAAGKDVVFVLGTTGSGKSTFVNYLVWCRMVSRKRQDVGLTGPGEVIMVDSDNGPDKFMQIGHDYRGSLTVMPQIALAPNHNNQLIVTAQAF